ncbi:phosphatidate cytidylyltransferase [Microbacterium sp.]|uniref:phosphatidate cytidylyltransferase n=1 Tax=Microbacterium sp. TaxID=51671 RepID=UPI003A889786
MTDPDDTPSTRAEARRNTADSSFQSHARSARDEFEHQIEKARADFEQANERIIARSGRDLLAAIGIGLLIGAAVLASLVFVKWLFIIIAIPAVMLAVFEFVRALQASGRRVDLIAQEIAAATVMLAAAFLDDTSHWVVIYAAVAFLVVYRLLKQMIARDGRRYGEVIGDVLVSGLVALYIPLLSSLALVLLRQDGGEYWLIAMIAITVASDTGASAAGVALGRHPMAPRISPNKTWEGFGGAFLASAIVAVLIGMFVLHLPWWASLVIGVAILGTATLGDLGESMIKRDLGIKDMSSALPGHGGLLDRLDSILPSTVPALALYFLFSPLGSM